MSSTLLFMLIVSFAVSLLVFGIVFLNTGYKVRREGSDGYSGMIAFGWIALGALSLGVTIGTFYVVQQYASGILIALLFLSPIILLVATIVMLSRGIINLATGYKTKDVRKITSGYVFIGVVITLYVMVALLILWFSNYLQAHPISLM